MTPSALDHLFEVDDQAEGLELHIPEPQQQTPPALFTSTKAEFVFKFLLVGDSDVGKEEILQNLEDDGEGNSEIYRSLDVAYKSTSILLFGKTVHLHIWNASGQGRFSTILNTYSRGAQGVILVYDITNKYSFKNLDRWLQEIDKHTPGVPKILIGNRKHLAFRRCVPEKQAKNYATKHNMAFLEVSPLCNFNVMESCAELSRLVLERNGMKDFWTSTHPTLQELCYRTIVKHLDPATGKNGIENLPLPPSMKTYLSSFSSTIQSNYSFETQLEALKKQKSKRKSFSVKCSKLLFNCDKSSGVRLKPLRRIFSFKSSSPPTSTTAPTRNENNESPVLHSKRNNHNRFSCAIS